MPQPKTLQTVKLILPSSDEGDPLTVTLSKRLSGNSALLLSETENRGEGMAKVLAAAVKSWNLTDGDGKELEIDETTILDYLDASDMTFLVGKLTDKIQAIVTNNQVGIDEKKV